jgi:hypothetical protein
LAVGDPTHIGDIVGALGRIRREETSSGRSHWQRLLMLLVVGSGLIVMVGDNGAGTVATYTQAGLLEQTPGRAGEQA